MGGFSYAVAAGGANLDVHSRLLGPVRLRDSNPGHVSLSPGGVGRNIAENLARLGVPVSLLSAAGDDAFGDSILSLTARAGVDVSRVVRVIGHVSSLYLDITDEEGDMYLASSDMRVLEKLPASYFKDNEDLLKGAGVIVTDGNLSPEQLSALFSSRGKARIFADPVSTVKAEKFLPVLGELYCIKPNRMELEVLSGLPTENTDEIRAAVSAVLGRGCYSVAVSLGTDGCYYADKSGTAFFRPVPEKAEAVNTTGAGDAFIAGWAAALLKGFPPTDCADVALNCGFIAARSETTISEHITPALLNLSSH